MTPVLRPEGWTPRPGSRVRILPDPKAAADEPLPPAGVWYVIDRAPEPTHWWLWAHDDEAKAWTAASPSNARLARCLSLPSRRLVPTSVAYPA
jgi:hypothetical protein